MKKDKQIIIDFAKELYLQYDSEGKKVYSLRDIAKEVRQKFDNNLTAQTINNYAAKYDWNKLIEKIKQQSIKKASDEKFTTEEQLTEAISDDLAITYKRAKELENLSYDAIVNIMTGKQTKEIILRDVTSLFKTSVDIKFRIMDVPEKVNPDQIEIPIIKFIRTKK